MNILNTTRLTVRSMRNRLFVPLAINLPIETEFIRTVDLFPTVLSQFGRTVEPSQIDGGILH